MLISVCFRELWPSGQAISFEFEARGMNLRLFPKHNHAKNVTRQIRNLILYFRQLSDMAQRQEYTAVLGTLAVGLGLFAPGELLRAKEAAPASFYPKPVEHVLTTYC